jgi:hypothetical protein
LPQEGYDRRTQNSKHKCLKKLRVMNVKRTQGEAAVQLLTVGAGVYDAAAI